MIYTLLARIEILVAKRHMAPYYGGMEKVKVFDRRAKKQVEEKIPGEGALRFLYESGEPLAGGLLKAVAKLPVVSKAFGYWQKLPHTKKQIELFIKEHDIDLSEFEKRSYTCFDDFFTRKLAHGARTLATSDLTSPADSRCFLFENIAEMDGIYVKGQKFSLSEFIQDDSLTHRFLFGSLALFRLAPVDYHWVHAPLDGKITKICPIDGPLFSVNPIALSKNIKYLFQNKRVVCEIETSIGTVLAVFVGATNVGSIHLEISVGDTVKKGDPLGYFSFGGSSVVFLFEPNRIKFSADIIEQTAQKMETLVKMGEELGSFS